MRRRKGRVLVSVHEAGGVRTGRLFERREQLGAGRGIRLPGRKSFLRRVVSDTRPLGPGYCAMGLKTQAVKLLHVAWDKKVRGMQQLNQGALVRPLSAREVITVDSRVTGGTVKVDCGPVAFKLCERAGDIPEMYVVVKGSICVRANNSGIGRQLETMWFGTKVGYFRWKQGQLAHVYGVHYDMDERGLGHPVFHGQLGPARDFASVVEDHFRLGGEVVDRVGPMLRNVRTPTAQMDFFSVFTQLCADHLMGAKATPGERGGHGGFRRPAFSM